MTNILTDFGTLQNTISMLCYVFIQAYFDVFFSSIGIMLPVHFTQIMCCVKENYKIKSASFLLLMTYDNGETSTNFRFGQTIRVFISLPISFLLCAWFNFRADTVFATVDLSPQKINIKIGRNIAHLI